MFLPDNDEEGRKCYHHGHPANSTISACLPSSPVKLDFSTRHHSRSSRQLLVGIYNRPFCGRHSCRVHEGYSSKTVCIGRLQSPRSFGFLPWEGLSLTPNWPIESPAVEPLDKHAQEEDCNDD